MKFRTRARRYGRKVFAIENAGGGDGGTGGGGSEGAEGGASGNGNAGGQNKDGGNAFDFGTMWAEPKANSDAAPDAGQPTVIVQQPSAELTPDEQFAKHVSELNLMDGFNAEEALQSPEKLTEAMQGLLSKTYRAAMLNSNNLVNERVEAVQTQMQEQTSTTLQGQKILDSMYEALPFTQQPAYQPVAEGVLNKILATGKTTPEQAIVHVKKYFEDLSAQIAGKTGNAADNGGVNNGFPRGEAHSQQQSGTVQSKDFWNNLLQGKPTD